MSRNPIARITDFDFQTDIQNDFSVTGNSSLNGQVEIKSGDLYVDQYLFVAQDLKVNGTTTSGGQLTVSDGGADITGDSTVTGKLTATDKLTVSAGGADISDNLNVTGTTTSGGKLTVSANGADITGDSKVTGNLNVTGPTTSGGLLTVSAGGADITGDSTVTGKLTATDKLTVSSNGADITGDSKVTGNLNVTGTTTSGGKLTVSDGGAEIKIYDPITHAKLNSLEIAPNSTAMNVYDNTGTLKSQLVIGNGGIETNAGVVLNTENKDSAIEVVRGRPTDFVANPTYISDKNKFATQVNHGIYVDAINVGSTQFSAQDGSAGITFTSGADTPSSSLVVNAPVTINGSLSLPNGSISSETDRTVTVTIASGSADIEFKTNPYGAFFIMIDEIDVLGASIAEGACAMYSACVKSTSSILNRLSGISGGSGSSLRNITASWNTTTNKMTVTVTNADGVKYKVRILSPSAFTTVPSA